MSISVFSRLFKSPLLGRLGARWGRPRVCAADGGRAVLHRLRGEEGAATAEYAIATLAAVGLAGVLVAILKGDEVRALLTELVRGALSVAG